MKQFLILLTTIFIWTCSSSPTKSEPAPQPPTVNNLSITTNEDVPATFTMTGTDPEGAALTFSVSTQPQNGTVTASGAAGTYTPNENFNGTDTFAYIASDGALSSTAGVVNVTVTAVDDDPNTMNVSAITDEDNVVVITLEAEEYDGDTISFNIKDNPTSGTVTISGDKATYTPNENYYGSDSFTFEAVDYTAKKILNTATASVTINPINDAPVVEDITVEEWNNKDITITLTGTDVEGDNLTFQIVDNPTNVNATIDGSTLTINKSSSFWGADSLTYYAYDGTDYGETATVDINFKRYINYNRSSYELKHNELWFDFSYFANSSMSPTEGSGLSSSVSVADFNGDGYLDVLHAPMESWPGGDVGPEERMPVELFINDGDNINFTLDNELISNNVGGEFPRKVLTGDFNGDNMPDAFLVDHGWDGDGTFNNPYQSVVLSQSDGSYDFVIIDDGPRLYGHGGASADIDNDGDLDVFVVAGSGQNSNEVNGYFYLNNGDGTFTYDSSLLNFKEATLWEAEFYDVNGDNREDLLITGYWWNDNSYLGQIYLNDGVSFNNESTVITLPTPTKNDAPNWPPNTLDFCFKDLDNDGDIEIMSTVTWDYEDGQIVIWDYDGQAYQDVTSSLMDSWDMPGDIVYRLRLQDIDQDGRTELFRFYSGAANNTEIQDRMWEWNGSKFIPEF